MSGRSGPLKVAMVALNSEGYRSLGLAYVRAYAEAHPRLRDSVAFMTLDLTADLDPWLVAYRVLGTGADVVAFSVVCWSAQGAYEACRVLKKASSPDIRIVVGGPEVGPVAEHVLAAHPEIDVVVRGEGEQTFAEVLEAMLAGRDCSGVDGATARRGGQIVSAPDRDAIQDLDSIPSPYLSGLLSPVDGATYLEGYRGCPHDCAYCFEAKGYRGIRSFSRERIEAEIEMIATATHVRSFSFVDSVFNLTDERLEWFAEAMRPHVSRGIRIHTIEIDIERVDDRVAGLLQSAGVASVEVGPQTVGATALEACHRRFDATRFKEGVDALRRRGIRVICDLIVGLPGDDIFDVLAAMRFVLGCDPGRMQTSTLRVLPGTELWENAEDLGLRFDAEPPHEVISTPEMSFLDLRRIEVMAGWVETTYRARL